jgi:hypothetical protein
VLRFTTIDGRKVTAKVVTHPGYPGKHVVSRAMTEGLVAFEAIGAPAAERWARRMQH